MCKGNENKLSKQNYVENLHRIKWAHCLCTLTEGMFNIGTTTYREHWD